MYLQFIACDTATPRHAFALTDDQARVLARHVAALQTSHPLDPRNHRAFVRAFLRAVRDAAGQLRSVVSNAIDAGMVRVARSAFGNGSQLAFYEARLRETEQQLLDVREYAARLATDVALARQLAEQHEQAAKRTGAALALRVDAVAKLTAEVTALPLPAWRPITTRHGLYYIVKGRLGAAANLLEAEGDGEHVLAAWLGHRDRGFVAGNICGLGSCAIHRRWRRRASSLPMRRVSYAGSN